MLGRRRDKTEGSTNTDVGAIAKIICRMGFAIVVAHLRLSLLEAEFVARISEDVLAYSRARNTHPSARHRWKKTC